MLKRFRFMVNPDDPRPVVWPIKHPYWITGGNDDHTIVVAYEEDISEVMRLWPDAVHIGEEDAKGYVFTPRFPKPVWWSPSL